MEDIIIERLKNSATWIDHLLITGAGLAGVVVLLKLSGKHDFEAWGVKFSSVYAWLVFSIFSTAHFYLSYVFRSDITLIINKYPASKVKAWETLTGSDLFFFHGLVARLNFVDVRGTRLFVMDGADPTTWLAHGGALLVFLAIIRVRKTSWLIRLSTLIAATIITAFNWLIGGGWVVTVSLLSHV